MVVLIVLFVCGVYFVSGYNGIKRAEIKVEEALSGIDVALMKRYDTLSNLNATVKGYAEHERETLKDVVAYRKEMTLSEKKNCDKEYSEMQSRLLILAEGYPDLKASQNFMQLQDSIVEVEEHLQAARRLYNANVSNLNQRLEMFPSSIIGQLAHCEKAEFFAAKIDE